jgi:hypothetical protein
VRRRTVPGPRACTLYWPGHHVHWIPWRKSLYDPVGIRGPIVAQDGDRFDVALRDGSLRSYRHHDPERLHALIEAGGATVWVQERWSILRIGSGHCLCIAKDTGTPLEPCSTAAPDTASPRARGTSYGVGAATGGSRR